MIRSGLFPTAKNSVGADRFWRRVEKRGRKETWAALPAKYMDWLQKNLIAHAHEKRHPHLGIENGYDRVGRPATGCRSPTYREKKSIVPRTRYGHQ